MPCSPFRPVTLAVAFALAVGAFSAGAAQTTAPSAPAAGTTKPTASAAMPAGFVKEFGTMWTFDAPPLEYWKARYGFTPDQAWLDNARLASVRLPICSSSFVSSEGLVMTNHHCGRDCITAVSPADTSYQRAGFVARTLAEEKKCPGLYVDQLQSVEDITAKVRNKVTATTTAAKVTQRDGAIQQIENECKQQTGDVCQVVTFYQGGRYSLYRYKRFSDVRLVMAPEEAISFFGGDPDNFTYPRFDLDLTLLRVYQNDAPMKTEHYFKWSAAGAKEGDLVFVIGNPGSTGRLLTLAQMEYLRDVTYPGQLAQLKRNIAVYQEMVSQSDEARRRWENQLFYAQNSFKAINGYQAGLLDTAIMAKKRKFEDAFRARVNHDPTLRGKYGDAWDKIAAALKQERTLAVKSRFYGFGGSQLLSMAGILVRLPEQSALPDAARLPAYRGDGIEKAKSVVQGDVPIDKEVEKQTLAAQLTAARKELPASDPYLNAVLQGRSPEVAAEALIEKTSLADPAARKALIDGGAAAVRSSNDPLIVVARKIGPLSRSVAMRNDSLESVASANAERIGQALYAAYGTSLPPDATFTLRISDGVVQGYPMNGTKASYKTTLYGLYGRSADFDDQPPFQLPDRWKAARDRVDLATPMDLVTTNDIIGGNSGSPVINQNAEVVGLIFDGNIESLPNRFIFTDEVARSVAVHSRAISEALRKVYDAGRVADELEGTKVSQQ
ncbi:MAG TPA: S46 family peptidase [Gemmatimonadales bacterium]|nr:S46 family peptidase [Gemmatimonadales bacterium]